MTLIFALVRAAHLLALMTIFGTEALRVLLRRALAAPPGPALSAKVFQWCALAAFVTSVAWLALTAAMASGNPAAAFDAATIRAVAGETSFGPILIARIAACGFLAAAAFIPGAQRARLLLSGFAIVNVAFTSHAAASGQSHVPLRMANDAAHLLAAAFWVGAIAELFPLAIAGRASPRTLIPPLKVFSLWGTIAVAVLIAAGTLNGVMILDASPMLWSPTYLTLLAVKIVLAALMVGLALANRFSLLPGIDAGKPEAEQNLLGSMGAEFACGAIIVLIVGVLGITSPLMQ